MVIVRISIFLLILFNVKIFSQLRDPIALWFWGNRSPATVISVPNNLVMKGSPFIATYRTYIRLRETGDLQLSFWYRNIMDSQSEHPNSSPANDSCSAFKIVSATIADGGTVLNGSVIEGTIRQVKWKGSLIKNVARGESFWSDTVSISLPEGHYLAFTWTVEKLTTANAVPHAYQNQYSSYVYNGSASSQIGNSGFSQTGGIALVPNAIAYKKTVNKVIGFIGNSITQGFSTSMNSYSFWVAEAARILGPEYGVWNLGSGWAQARDAATNKAWLGKIKYCDEAVICLGVNDLRNGATSDQVFGYLTTIINSLLQLNPSKRIILCTVPPFNFTGSAEIHWRAINTAIRSNPPPGVYKVFDIASILSQNPPNENFANSLYGDGHPNDAGGRVVGQVFANFYLDTPSDTLPSDTLPSDTNDILIGFDASTMRVVSSSIYTGYQHPVEAVNGDGLIDDKHDNHQYGEKMWMTRNNDVNGAWFEVDLGKSRKLKRMRIWNYNQLNGTNRGIKNCTILYRNRIDESWKEHTRNVEFSKADGTNQYKGFNYLFSEEISAKYVRIVVDSNFGTDSYGNYTGLSEVKFFESAPLSLPACPVLLLPVADSILPDTLVRLTWYHSQDATGYSFQISTDSLFSTIIREGTGITDTAIVVSGLTSNTTHYWRVRASNETGFSMWSATSPFSIMEQNKVPVDSKILVIEFMILTILSYQVVRKYKTNE